MKSPLLWFLVIGGILFAVDAYRNDAPQSASIIVDSHVKQRIEQLWQSQMSRAPTEAELDSLVQDWVKDEMFYREAIRLGLDKDDTIVRRRMIQKLGFLIDDIAEQPATEPALNAFYSQNLARYRLPHRYTFSQIFFNDKNDATALSEEEILSNDWRKLGHLSLLHKTLASKTEREIAATLGNPFVKHLAALKLGRWLGPLESSYGFHWVRLDAEIAAKLAPFDQVYRQVEIDYEDTRKQQEAEDYYSALKESYPVEYP